MKAQVVGIESGTAFLDGEERLMLEIKDADGLFNRVRFKRGVIDTTHSLKLDDEIELTISAGGDNSIKIAQMNLSKLKAKAERHEL